jgi:acetyltransferase-like isoleucine patch superfamily enzyme
MKFVRREMLQSLVDYVRGKLDPIAYARSLGVQVGERCRLISIRPGAGTFGSEPYLVSIGDHVTVCGAVQFVTHDGGVWVFRDREPDIDVFGPISVGSNVFLGYGAILMPGVTVGDNVIIGAGAVVARDIPADSVAVGCPARVVSSLDDYYASISSKRENIRSMTADQRRAYLLRKYRGK